MMTMTEEVADVRPFSLAAYFGFRGRPMRVITEAPLEATIREHWFAETGYEASLTTEELRLLWSERYRYDPETNTIHLDRDSATGRLALDEDGRPLLEAERDPETGAVRALRFRPPRGWSGEPASAIDEDLTPLGDLDASQRFDDLGRPTYTRFRDRDGRLVEERFYRYGARGLVSSVMRLSPLAALRILFEYELDPYGNWTSRRSLQRDLMTGDEAITTARRVIAYW